jgi:uncharacterized protein (DUF885 family)
VSTFRDLVPPFFADLFRANPVLATTLGNHDHDAEWPDLSPAGTAARRSILDRWEEAFAALPEADLDRDESVDREIVVGELAAYRFSESILCEEAWDPLSTVYLVGSGLHSLLAREFAPLGVRLAAAAGRIEGIPRLMAAASARLTGLPGRPVSRLHLDTALRHLPGTAELFDEALAAASAADEDGELSGVRARLESGIPPARDALDRFGRYLADVVGPVADGEGRLGPALYADKLRHALRVDMTPDELERRARREFDIVRAELIRVARSMWPDVRGTEVAPDDDAAVVRAMLDHVAAQHQQPAALLDFCRDELARLEAFCRARDVVDLPTEPLVIAWTPPFLRAFAGAMLLSPGPLDRGLGSFFFVTPMPADRSPEQVESSLREDNDRMLRLLTIHEAVPGHYLQLAYSNRARSLVRAVFGSGVFSEGWAVYITQVMMDLGYGGDDAALLLTHWKFYLRTITNALIDVGIHARGMTEAEAVGLMVEGGFQERAEAVAKYERARLSSAQLAEYFVGSAAMWDLEHERRCRLAAASGDPRGAAAVPTPRVVGGYGPTPGFAYGEHLRAVLAHGSPPIPAFRRILLG